MSSKLRVVTLNLWHNDEVVLDRLKAAAAEILERKPHIVLLQEVRAGFMTQEFPGREDAATLLARMSGMKVAVSEPTFDLSSPLGEEATSGLAILTTLDVERAWVEELPSEFCECPQVKGAAFAWMKAPSGRSVLAVSSHLPWGSGEEPHRLENALGIDKLVKRELANPEYFSVKSLGNRSLERPIVVLGGDFNTGANSDTLRFLSGEGAYGRHGTLWLDAWKVAGNGEGFTSSPKNHWAGVTARGAGISDPSLLPERRIDFLLVNDWAYGKPGCPLGAELCFTSPHAPDGGEPVLASDHYGVQADLWDPTYPLVG